MEIGLPICPHKAHEQSMTELGTRLASRTIASHPAERKRMDKLLEQAEMGFLLPTLGCEELRRFHTMLSTTAKSDSEKVMKRPSLVLWGKGSSRTSCCASN